VSVPLFSPVLLCLAPDLPEATSAAGSSLAVSTAAAAGRSAGALLLRPPAGSAIPALAMAPVASTIAPSFIGAALLPAPRLSSPKRWRPVVAGGLWWSSERTSGSGIKRPQAFRRQIRAR
jgi:hypothetical protein